MHRNGRLRCVAVVWLYIDTARAGTKTKCARRGLRLRCEPCPESLPEDL